MDMAQLVQCFLNVSQTRAPPQHRINPAQWSTSHHWGAEAGRLEVQGYLWLYSVFKASVGYVWLFQKTAACYVCVVAGMTKTLGRSHFSVITL